MVHILCRQELLKFSPATEDTKPLRETLHNDCLVALNNAVQQQLLYLFPSGNLHLLSLYLL